MSSTLSDSLSVSPRKKSKKSKISKMDGMNNLVALKEFMYLHRTRDFGAVACSYGVDGCVWVHECLMVEEYPMWECFSEGEMSLKTAEEIVWFMYHPDLKDSKLVSVEKVWALFEISKVIQYPRLEKKCADILMSKPEQFLSLLLKKGEMEIGRSVLATLSTTTRNKLSKENKDLVKSFRTKKTVPLWSYPNISISRVNDEMWDFFMLTVIGTDGAKEFHIHKWILAYNFQFLIPFMKADHYELTVPVSITDWKMAMSEVLGKPPKQYSLEFVFALKRLIVLFTPNEDGPFDTIYKKALSASTSWLETNYSVLSFENTIEWYNFFSEYHAESTILQKLSSRVESIGVISVYQQGKNLTHEVNHLTQEVNYLSERMASIENKLDAILAAMN